MLRKDYNPYLLALTLFVVAGLAGVTTYYHFELTTLADAYENATAKVSLLTGRLSTETEKADTLERFSATSAIATRTLEDRYVALEKENEYLTAKLDTLTAEYAHDAQHLTKARADLATLTQRFKDLQHSLETSNAELSQLHHTKRELCDQLPSGMSHDACL